jgi:uracil phosphoribosyltransferase
MKPLKDSQYRDSGYRLSEREHRYGSRVHLLSDPWLHTELAKLCSSGTEQPLINTLIQALYTSLIRTVVNTEFPQVNASTRTRMADAHPEGVFESSLLDPKQKAVTVNLARAGTLPSHICYSELNHLLDPKGVRQDHISIARQTDRDHHVTGSAVSGHKIGGSIDGSILLIPDPMGATGATLDETLNLYRSYGSPTKKIAIHCIVTPEYLKRVSETHPELIVYAIRLDRGLSPAAVLETLPGTEWALEKGLNDNQYIVPGGGGFGEILNNAYV